MSEEYNPKYRGRIEQWGLIQTGQDVFNKPIYKLVGQIFDDQAEVFVDGTEIMTSGVRLVEGGVVYTKHNIYHLGEPYNQIQSNG